MPAPNPFAGTDDDFNPLTDWKESVANYSPSGTSMFSRKSGESGLVGMVEARKAKAAIRYMLGYAAVGGDPGAYTLLRTPPVFHPEYPSLICRSVADEKFKAYPTAGGSLKQPADNAGLDGAQSLFYRARYKKSRLTLRFEPAMWPVLADGAMTGFGEWKRWCYVNQEPRAEILRLDGFQMVFFEGSGTTPPISSPSGKAVPSDIGRVLVKSDIQVVWEEVPEDWLMATAVANGISISPTKILAGLGCINSLNWNGYLAGTLLLNGVRFTRHPWPLFAGTESRYIYTVEFLMSFFDPPKGYTGSGAGFTQLNRLAVSRSIRGATSACRIAATARPRRMTRTLGSGSPHPSPVGRTPPPTSGYMTPTTSPSSSTALATREAAYGDGLQARTSDRSPES